MDFFLWSNDFPLFSFFYAICFVEWVLREKQAKDVEARKGNSSLYLMFLWCRQRVREQKRRLQSLHYFLCFLSLLRNRQMMMNDSWWWIYWGLNTNSCFSLPSLSLHHQQEREKQADTLGNLISFTLPLPSCCYRILTLPLEAQIFFPPSFGYFHSCLSFVDLSLFSLLTSLFRQRSFRWW